MSMRLIDAEYLLYGMGIFSERENGAEFIKGVDAVSDMIEKAETISPAANWTPCSKGLPENQKDVLIYFDRCGGEIGIGYYGERSDGKRLWCVMGSMLCYNVLAWQPLPEPYRG